MSKTVAQIFALNPTTVVADTDLYYLVQSPYTPGADAAITGASLKAAFGAGGTINPGLINQLGYYATAGSTISGLATLASGTLITSAGGVPSISQTLPSTVQGNITSLGTISSGTWNGTLVSGTYGGTGVNNGARTITIGGNFAMSGAFTFAGTLSGNTAVTFPTSGTLATTSQLLTSPLTTKGDLWGWSTTNDRLAVGSTNGQVLQVNSAATLGLSYSTATYPTTATNVARILRSNATNWVESTSTFADTYSASTVLYSNGANNVAGLATANNGLLVTSSAGVPSILAGPGTTGNMLISNAAAAPSFTTFTYPTTVGASGSIHISNGTNIVSSTSLWPNTVGGAGTLLRSDGTLNTYTTSTYPNTNAVNTLLYASSANVMAALATANSSMLSTTSGGVPTWIAKSGVIGSVVASRITALGAFTYTPTTGMVVVRVRMTGAGGGGGGVDSNVGQSCSAAAGNGGGFLEFYMTAAQIGASKTGSIGTGGTGATAGANPGNAGGNTTFADWTAVGGNGGAGTAGTTLPQVAAAGAAATNTVGTGTVLQDSGSTWGVYGFSINGLAITGAASASALGTPGYAYAITTGTVAGVNNGSKGSGGGGAAGINVNANLAGGNGGDGSVILEEFIGVA